MRLDPCPSKVFSWMEREGDVLRIKYRYNGAVWEFWPVSEEEAKLVMNPGQKYGFSIGSAFSQVIKAMKNGRLVSKVEKPEPKRFIA